MKWLDKLLSKWDEDKPVSINKILNKSCGDNKDAPAIKTVEKKQKNKISVIDATEPYKIALKELLENLHKIELYEQLLKIDEKDRYLIMEEAYNRWGYNGVPKDLYEKYPKYDKESLDFIYRKEHERINQRTKIYHYYIMNSNFYKNTFDDFEKWYRLFDNVDGSSEYNFDGAICHFDDLLLLNFTNKLDFWKNGFFIGLDVVPCIYVDSPKKRRPIKIYHNGNLHSFTLQQFKK